MQSIFRWKKCTLRQARSQTVRDEWESGPLAEEADDRASSDKEQEQLLQWMWADAGFSHALARANPLRWSARLPAPDIEEQLIRQTASRPVSLRVCGHRHVVKFTSARSAAEWIRGAAGSREIEQQKPPKTLGLLSLSLFIAPAACTYFLRTNAKTSWRRKNVFAASLYALRITQLPHRIAKTQEFVEISPHQRRSADNYAGFDSSTAKALIHFIDAASLPLNDRPQELEVSGLRWVCVESAPFWMGWLHDESGASVIAFRGGDGGKDDACCHPGSPVRAFINGDDETQPPSLPMALMQELSERAAEAQRKHGSVSGGISLVGYSQGALPALACALSLAPSDQASSHLVAVELLNPATMFWPTWFVPPLLRDNWWAADSAPLVSAKIRSWVIKNDPLSEGLPGKGGFRAPLLPGTTIVLPSKHFDQDIIHNHDLSNFK